MSEPSATSAVETTSRVPTMVTTVMSTPPSSLGSSKSSDSDDAPGSQPPQTLPSFDGLSRWCRALGELRASVDLVGVTWSFAPANRAAVAEVVASSAIAADAVVIEQLWPEAIARERDGALGPISGRYAARAERAIEALRLAGADDVDLDELQDVWLAVLAVQDRDDPLLGSLAVPQGLDEMVDNASGLLLANDPPWYADPNLVSDPVATPSTDAFIATECGAVNDLLGVDDI
jgi:hypothetical protein